MDAIEHSVRMTTKAYGYQHLGMIGTHLKAQWRSFTPSDYGCKTLLELIERYPERIKVKWSAPAHKGRSHVWIRLAAEPKRKDGYDHSPAPPPKPKPRLMTAKEFGRLCEWLDAQSGCDGSLRKTRQWLRRRDFLSMEGNTKLLKQLGGRAPLPCVDAVGVGCRCAEVIQARSDAQQGLGRALEIVEAAIVCLSGSEAAEVSVHGIDDVHGDQVDAAEDRQPVPCPGKRWVATQLQAGILQGVHPCRHAIVIPLSIQSGGE
ncbi:MAG: OST-HTH/LOTUS domain-containing protein [Chloroflexi bacterium]|nr:OST-HTH/LOTUS domain-containing protein [Chloroflexota bacterium]